MAAVAFALTTVVLGPALPAMLGYLTLVKLPKTDWRGLGLIFFSSSAFLSSFAFGSP